MGGGILGLGSSRFVGCWLVGGWGGNLFGLQMAKAHVVRNLRGGPADSAVWFCLGRWRHVGGYSAYQAQTWPTGWGCGPAHLHPGSAWNGGAAKGGPLVSFTGYVRREESAQGGSAQKMFVNGALIFGLTSAFRHESTGPEFRLMCTCFVWTTPDCCVAAVVTLYASSLCRLPTFFSTSSPL